jgi:hypothetical protein
MSSKKHKINNFFICIGAEKAGTTWLHSSLKHHPLVAMPPIKELRFFNEIEPNRTKRLLERIFSRKWSHRKWRKQFKSTVANLIKNKNFKDNYWKLKYLLTFRHVHSIRRYKALLTNLAGTEKKTVGEITPVYSLLSKDIIQQISKVLPELKIIFILRNPVEQEWSFAKMVLLKSKGLGTKDFNKDKFKEFLGIQHKGTEYLKLIQKWETFFPKEQIKICFYDDLKKQPLHFLNEISDFLEISRYSENPNKNISNRGLVLDIDRDIEKFLYKKHYGLINEMTKYFSDQERNHPYSWKKKADRILHN